MFRNKVIQRTCYHLSSLILLLSSNFLTDSAIGRSSFPLTHEGTLHVSNHRCTDCLAPQLYAIVGIYRALNSLKINAMSTLLDLVHAHMTKKFKSVLR